MKLKGKNLNIFVRFGGLDLKTQKGFGRESYHAPPATRGFYAFPFVAQEFFLIGAMDVFQPGTIPKEPKKQICGEDENGIAICAPVTQEEWDKHHIRRKKALAAKRKQFYKNTGNVWHHLSDYIDRCEMIAEHGSWVKTSIKEWQRAFSRMSLEHRYGNDNGLSNDTSINETKGLLGWYSKDHCEVFFDEKV